MHVSCGKKIHISITKMSRGFPRDINCIIVIFFFLKFCLLARWQAFLALIFFLFYIEWLINKNTKSVSHDLMH